MRVTVYPDTMQNWRARLKKIIDETPGLTMKTLSVRAGLNASTVQSIVTRGVSPSIDNFVAICAALRVSPADLLGEGSKSPEVPLVGIVTAGETWAPVNDPPLGSGQQFDLGSHDVIGIEVRDHSMSPVYRNGDFLICNRQFGPNADNCIGLDCAVRTATGQSFLKILKRGSRNGRFTLRGYNPAAEDIEDVSLAWAAPVVWIKRGGR